MNHLKVFASLIITTLSAACGAALGTQVFFWQTPWLLQSQGGFYVSDSAPYAATGAAVGVLGAEGVLIGLSTVAAHRRARKQRSEQLRQILMDEAIAQGLSLEELAVVRAAVEKAEQENS